MSRHHLPLKPKPPKYLMPELGNQLGKAMMATWSRVTPLSISTKSSLTTLPSELHYSTDVNSLGPSSVTTQSSWMISTPTHLTCMEDDSNKLLPFRWEQSPEANVNTSELPTSPNTLETMGLENQMLMIRLGFPLTLCRSQT